MKQTFQFYKSAQNLKDREPPKAGWVTILKDRYKKVIIRN